MPQQVYRHNEDAAPRDEAGSSDLDSRDVPRADVHQGHLVGRDSAHSGRDSEDRVETPLSDPRAYG